MRSILVPTAAPKPPFPSRADALREGVLIPLSELGPAVPRIPGLHVEWSMTEGLVRLSEDLPFQSIGRVSPEERLRQIVGRAAFALDRARGHYGAHFMGALMHGFQIDFAVPLRCRATDPAYRFVRLHCGPDDEGEIVLTLGRIEELPADASATAESERRAPRAGWREDPRERARRSDASGGICVA